MYNILRNYKFWIYEKDKSHTNYEIKVNNKGDLMIKINDTTDEETFTFYYFHANFKINKMFLDGNKLNKDFSRQCKYDKKRYIESA